MPTPDFWTFGADGPAYGGQVPKIRSESLPLLLALIDHDELTMLEVRCVWGGETVYLADLMWRILEVDDALRTLFGRGVAQTDGVLKLLVR